MTSKGPLKLAILDDYASIGPPAFSQIPDLSIDSYPKTLDSRDKDEHEKLVQLLKDYDIISTMRERTIFPASVLTQLPKLKLLLTTGPKNASIDAAVCKEQGIVYCGTMGKPNAKPGFDATNEQTWALILGLIKNISFHDNTFKTDKTSFGSGDLTRGLGGKTLGLLGLGRLGTSAGLTGHLGFGMNVIAWSSNLTQDKADQQAESRGLPKGTFKVVASKKELFEQADVVSVHYVLSDRSRGIVGKEELAAMMKTAILVNTSRGPLIDESALLETLNAGKIRGAGIDVFAKEPVPEDSPWRSTEWGQNGKSYVIISPHMGYAEMETMHSWYEQQAANVKRWLAGEDVKVKIEA